MCFDETSATYIQASCPPSDRLEPGRAGSVEHGRRLVDAASTNFNRMFNFLKLKQECLLRLTGIFARLIHAQRASDLPAGAAFPWRPPVRVPEHTSTRFQFSKLKTWPVRLKRVL